MFKVNNKDTRNADWERLPGLWWVSNVAFWFEANLYKY